MRKFLLLLSLLAFSFQLSSQNDEVPFGFNYQGIARNLDGTILENKTIALRISILKDNETGNIAYQETHEVTTSQLGLFKIIIGNGNNILNSLEDISWGTGPHFLQVEIDLNNIGAFEILGQSELLSVPYALFAKNTRTSQFYQDSLSGQIIHNDGDENIKIANVISQDSNNVISVGSDGGAFLKDLSRIQDSIFNALAIRVNVKDFGALGDGLTDDSPSIQLALDSLCANGGGKIYFPAGVYRTSAPINLCSNIIAFGDHTATVIKPLAEWQPTLAFNSILGSAGTTSSIIENVYVRDLKVDGSDHTESVGQNGIMFSYSHDCTADNISVTGIENYGIWVREGYNYTIKNCYVNSAVECIEVSQNATNVQVLHNTVIANDITFSMILIYGVAKNVIVANNDLKGKAIGIMISASNTGCENITIQSNNVSVDNTANGGYRYAILIEPNNYSSKESISIIGGFYEAKNAAAIRIRDGVNGINISGLQIHAPNDFGIEVFNTNKISNFDFSGNIIHSLKGINLGSSENGSVSNNTINATGAGRITGRFSSFIRYHSNQLNQGIISIGSNSVANGNIFKGLVNANFEVHGNNNVLIGNYIGSNRNLDIKGDKNIVHSNILLGGEIINEININNSILNNIYH